MCVCADAALGVSYFKGAGSFLAGGFARASMVWIGVSQGYPG